LAPKFLMKKASVKRWWNWLQTMGPTGIVWNRRISMNPISFLDKVCLIQLYWWTRGHTFEWHPRLLEKVKRAHILDLLLEIWEFYFSPWTYFNEHFIRFLWCGISFIRFYNVKTWKHFIVFQCFSTVFKWNARQPWNLPRDLRVRSHFCTIWFVKIERLRNTEHRYKIIREV